MPSPSPINPTGKPAAQWSWSDVPPAMQSWLGQGQTINDLIGGLFGTTVQTPAQWNALSPGTKQQFEMDWAGATFNNPVAHAAALPGVAANAVTSAIGGIVSFVFQTIGGFLVSFVQGSTSAAGKQLAGGHLIGLVVAVAVVLVLFH